MAVWLGRALSRHRNLQDARVHHVPSLCILQSKPQQPIHLADLRVKTPMALFVWFALVYRISALFLLQRACTAEASTITVSDSLSGLVHQCCQRRTSRRCTCPWSTILNVPVPWAYQSPHNLYCSSGADMLMPLDPESNSTVATFETF